MRRTARKLAAQPMVPVLNHRSSQQLPVSYGIGVMGLAAGRTEEQEVEQREQREIAEEEDLGRQPREREARGPVEELRRRMSAPTLSAITSASEERSGGGGGGKGGREGEGKGREGTHAISEQPKRRAAAREEGAPVPAVVLGAEGEVGVQDGDRCRRLRESR